MTTKRSMNDGDDTTHWPLFGVGVALIVASALGTCHAHAEDKDRFGFHTRLTLARALVGEGGETTDHAVIAHLLYRRWVATRARQGWSFVTQVTRYCAPLRQSHRRARRIQTLRWEAIPQAVRDVVERFSRGQLADPCPSAWHFDRRASLRWTNLARACPHLETYNVFYRRHTGQR